MLASFLRYLEYEKRCSKHTITSYRKDLQQFQEFLDSHLDHSQLEETSHQDIRSWLIALLEQDLKPNSINRKIASLRAYFKFALKHQLIEKDPSRRIKVLKAPQALPTFAKEGELVEMLDQIVYEDGFKGTRTRLIMELLYGTGIRLSELIGLEENRVMLDQGVIKVLGKRNKQRIVPLPRSLQPLIRSYLDQKKEVFTDNYTPYLIVNNKGGQSYPMMIYRSVKKVLQSLSSLDKHSPHVLRHTFATHLLNKGADLNAVKELLGHANLAATQVYTHNTIDRLKTVFDQAHPKA